MASAASHGDGQSPTWQGAESPTAKLLALLGNKTNPADLLFRRIVAVLTDATLRGRAPYQPVIEAACAAVGSQDDDARRVAQIGAGDLQELALLAEHFKRSDLPATRVPLVGTFAYRLLLKALAAITRNRIYGLRPAASAAKRPAPGFLMAQILAGGRAGWRERSGLDALGGGLTVQEACVVFPRLLRDLGGPSASSACLALTTVFFRRYPRDLARFALSDQAGADACLTQDLAQFRFDASGLRRRPCASPGGPWFLPTSWIGGYALPIEYVQALQRLRAKRPEATNLHQLHDVDATTTSALEKYIHSIAPSSRPLTIGRLVDSLPRLVLAHCEDEVLAASLTMDFTLVTTAVLHYALVTAADRNRATSATYAALGFSGELARPIEEDFSLNPHPSDDAIKKFLSINLVAVVNAIGKLPSNALPRTLASAFNQAVPPLVALFRFFTGLRPTKHFDIALRSVALDQGWAVLSDKVSCDYWQRRLVALPEVLVRLLRLYCQRLEDLAGRFDPIRPRSAAQIRLRLLSDSTESLFFAFDEEVDAVRPLRGAAVNACFRSLGGFAMAPNAGRVVLERVIREGGGKSVEASAQAGHGADGQQPYARGSGLAPASVVCTVNRAWKNKLHAIRFDDTLAMVPSPVWQPTFAASQRAPQTLRTPLDGTEPCPFSADLGHLSRIYKLAADRLLLRPPASLWARLVCCLILRDGLAVRSELLAVLEEIITGGIFVDATERLAVVDAKLDRKGLRRVYFSPETVRAIAAVPAHPVELDDVIADSGAYVNALLPAPAPSAERALDLLLAAVRACQTFIYPGLVRAHTHLQINCRTAHPEILAREAGLSVAAVADEAQGTALRAGELQPLSFAHELRRIRGKLSAVIGAATARARRLGEAELALQFELDPLALTELGQVFIAMVHYLLFDRRCDASTVESYLSVIGPFLVWLEQVDDVPLGMRDLRAEYREYCDASIPPSDKQWSNREAMMNHLLDWVGQPRIRSREGTLADSYVYAVRFADVQRAIELVRQLPDHPMDQVRRAVYQLGATSAAPLRPNDPLHFRFEDVVGGPHPIAFVTPAAGTHTKSRSGERLVCLQVDRFGAFVAPFIAARAAVVKDRSAFIAGDSEDPRELKIAEKGSAVARAAVRLACGSMRVGVYSIRGMVISERLTGRLLLGDESHSALAMRNIGALGASENGHSSPLGGPTMYFHQADVVRRQLWDIHLADEGRDLSSAFVATLTDKSEDCIRKQRARYGLAARDVLKRTLTLERMRTRTTRLRPLEEMPGLVAPACEPREAAREPRAPHGLDFRDFASVAIRLLQGASPDNAAAGTVATPRDVHWIREGTEFWVVNGKEDPGVRSLRGLAGRTTLQLIRDCAVAAMRHDLSDMECVMLARCLSLRGTPWSIDNAEQLDSLRIVCQLQDRLAPCLRITSRTNLLSARKAARRVGIEDVQIARPANGLRFGEVEFESIALNRVSGNLAASTSVFIAMVLHYVTRNFKWTT